MLVVIGSCLFVFILWLSAFYAADIRWLHFFQAWMYIAAVALSLRENRWGYFIGFSAAALWDYINLCVTTFLASGVHWLVVSICSAQLQRIDQVVAVPAWIGNLLVVIGCVWGYIRLREKSWYDLLGLAVAFIATTGFFALAIAVCQPRYLPLFRGSLHPHAPW